MMAVPRCLITGCLLRDLAGFRSVWGDLHACGSALIFNACLNDKGEAVWGHNLPPEDGRPAVTISSAFPCFERRGVIAFDKWHAQYNQAVDARIR